MPDQATMKWEAALELLAASGELGPGKVSVLRMTRVIDVDGVLVLVVGFAFARNIIDLNRPAISRALAQVWGRDVAFEVTIDTSAEPISSRSRPGPSLSQSFARPTDPVPAPTPLPQQPSPMTPVTPVTPVTPLPVTPPPVPGAEQLTAVPPSDYGGYLSTPQPTAAPESRTSLNPDASRLNPRYTFDTYVQGASNRLARAAAFAVAEAPARANLNPLDLTVDDNQRAYNPLFIYGGSGLGKTHLLHAIGNYARKLYPGIRVKYVSSEEFVSDFIASVADGHMDSFKDRYRKVDILLLDDVQFLGGKEQTLEEFFHTFNALYMEDKQIVLTSDQPPHELKGFEERLISRFVVGLTTDVQPPDLETRTAILSRKARADGLDLPMDVLEYIATRVTTNIRELEGALIRVSAFASLNKQPIDRTLAEMVLKDIISDPAGEEITSALIMAQTADYFGMTIDDLCNESRKKTFVHVRHVAMYLCRELTDLSLPQIGREFGGRDHTTVMSANRKIRKQMAERRSTFNEVTELTSRIKQAAQTPPR